jgi:CRISPR/Cas system-associated exonuclease Cas4 (RecB family)
MKAKLKTGEIIEIIKNDDFSAAKYLNKETTQYIFDDEIEEIINNDNLYWMEEYKDKCTDCPFNDTSCPGGSWCNEED